MLELNHWTEARHSYRQSLWQGGQRQVIVIVNHYGRVDRGKSQLSSITMPGWTEASHSYRQSLCQAGQRQVTVIVNRYARLDIGKSLLSSFTMPGWT